MTTHLTNIRTLLDRADAGEFAADATLGGLAETLRSCGLDPTLMAASLRTASISFTGFAADARREGYIALAETFARQAIEASTSAGIFDAAEAF